MSKRKALPPRHKRLKRQGRLAAAVKWLPTFSGKNVLRGYCNHFAVDWRCAAIELKLLGVELDPAYLAQRERSEAETIQKRQEKKRQAEAAENQHWHPYTDSLTAFIDGDYVAHYDLEVRAREAESSCFQEDSLG